MAPIANEQINIELRLCLYYSFLVLENFLRVIYNQWALHIELTLNSVKFSLFDNIDIIIIEHTWKKNWKQRKNKGRNPQNNFFFNSKVEHFCNWLNWFWQGACKSAGEREWPAPGHDKNHGERHHRMLYSVTEKGWREEKRGSYRCLWSHDYKSKSSIKN